MDARQDLDQRRLPGAIRSEQRHDLARLEVEVDRVDGQDARETLGETAGSKDGSSRCRSRGLRRERPLPISDCPASAGRTLREVPVRLAGRFLVRHVLVDVVDRVPPGVLAGEVGHVGRHRRGRSGSRRTGSRPRRCRSSWYARMSWHLASCDGHVGPALRHLVGRRPDAAEHAALHDGLRRRKLHVLPGDRDLSQAEIPACLDRVQHADRHPVVGHEERVHVVVRLGQRVLGVGLRGLGLPGRREVVESRCLMSPVRDERIEDLLVALLELGRAGLTRIAADEGVIARRVRRRRPPSRPIARPPSGRAR